MSNTRQDDKTRQDDLRDLEFMHSYAVDGRSAACARFGLTDGQAAGKYNRMAGAAGKIRCRCRRKKKSRWRDARTVVGGWFLMAGVVVASMPIAHLLLTIRRAECGQMTFGLCAKDDPKRALFASGTVDDLGALGADLQEAGAGVFALGELTAATGGKA